MFGAIFDPYFIRTVLCSKVSTSRSWFLSDSDLETSWLSPNFAHFQNPVVAAAVVVAAVVIVAVAAAVVAVDAAVDAVVAAVAAISVIPNVANFHQPVRK